MTELSHVAFPEREFPEGEYVSPDVQSNVHLVLRACERYLSWCDKTFDPNTRLSIPDYVPDLESLSAAPPEHATKTVGYTERANTTFSHFGAPDQQFFDAISIKLFEKAQPDITEEERVIRRGAAIVRHVLDGLFSQQRN